MQKIKKINKISKLKKKLKFWNFNSLSKLSQINQINVYLSLIIQFRNRFSLANNCQTYRSVFPCHHILPTNETLYFTSYFPLTVAETFCYFYLIYSY